MQVLHGRHRIVYGSDVAIYALGNLVPKIHPDAYVHPDATVIGDVTIGAGSSVWPSAVIRGDDGAVIIGERTSVQDGCVLHTTHEFHTRVGDGVVLGHLVHLEGCTIEDSCLIGVGAIVLHRVRVGTGAVVAANAVLLNDMEVPAGALAVGAPATIKEGGKSRLAMIELGAASYVERSKLFKNELRRID